MYLSEVKSRENFPFYQINPSLPLTYQFVLQNKPNLQHFQVKWFVQKQLLVVSEKHDIQIFLLVYAHIWRQQ